MPHTHTMECMDSIFTLHILMHIRRMATTIITTISTTAMTTTHHITIWDTLHHSTRLISMVNNITIKTIPLMEVTLILLLMEVPISLKRVRPRLIQMKHPPDMLAMTRGNIHHPVLTGIISTFLNSRDCAVLVVSCLPHHHSTPATVKQNSLERPSLSSCFPSKQIARRVDSICLHKTTPFRTTTLKIQLRFVQVLSTTVFRMRALCFLPLKVSLPRLLRRRADRMHR
mmetsp:Transcript_7845/g.11850  ORF Transcript_7845/g.11850 Transcript_7845/m.11850 type:complete len:228 (+) Transcript_7845:845-1528(+)